MPLSSRVTEAPEPTDAPLGISFKSWAFASSGVSTTKTVMPLDSRAALVFSIDSLGAACVYFSTVISAVKSALLVRYVIGCQYNLALVKRLAEPGYSAIAQTADEPIPECCRTADRAG